MPKAKISFVNASSEKAPMAVRDPAARKVFRLPWSEEVHQEWMRHLPARNLQVETLV